MKAKRRFLRFHMLSSPLNSTNQYSLVPSKLGDSILLSVLVCACTMIPLGSSSALQKLLSFHKGAVNIHATHKVLLMSSINNNNEYCKEPLNIVTSLAREKLSDSEITNLQARHGVQLTLDGSHVQISGPRSAVKACLQTLGQIFNRPVVLRSLPPSVSNIMIFHDAENCWIGKGVDGVRLYEQTCSVIADVTGTSGEVGEHLKVSWKLYLPRTNNDNKLEYHPEEPTLVSLETRGVEVVSTSNKQGDVDVQMRNGMQWFVRCMQRMAREWLIVILSGVLLLWHEEVAVSSGCLMVAVVVTSICCGHNAKKEKVFELHCLRAAQFAKERSPAKE